MKGVPLMDWVQTNYSGHPAEGRGQAVTEHKDRTPRAGTGPVTTLENLVARGSDAGEAWRLFTQEFWPGCPALVSPALSDVPKIKRGTSNVFMLLYNVMLRGWKKDPMADLPSPSSCIAHFQRVGVMLPQFYAQAIWTLLLELLSNDPKYINPSNSALREILTIWALFFDAHAHPLSRDQPRKSTSSINWSCLPAPTAVQTMLKTKDRRIGGDDFQFRKFSDRLLHTVSGFPGTAIDELQIALLVTFHLLVINHTTDSIHTVDAVDADIEPFLNFASHLLHHADTFNTQELVVHRLSQHLRHSEPSVTHQQLLANLKKTRSYASIVFGGGSEWTSLLKSSKKKAESWRSLADFFVGALYGAQEHKSLRAAQNTWKLIEDAYTTRIGDSVKVTIPSSVYDTALTTFMALRRQDLAIQIWQYLRKNGIIPTVASWTAMIVGCRIAKRGDAIEEVWDRMHRAAIEPDARAYTEAIFGFLWCGHDDHGFRLLHEMSDKWTRAVQRIHGKPLSKVDVKSIGDLPGAPKPTTGTLNTVITALSKGKQRRHHDIAKVFAWAQALGIPLTIDTFNVMLQMHLEQSDMENAMKVLRNMQDNDIQPNVVTFSMLSNIIFGRSGTIDLPPEEQLAFILRFLWEVESRGIAPNSHMYGTIIDGIIHRNADTAVAQGVLTHMRAKGMKPSVHICTMLMTYHFQQHPPDLEAIDALWRTMLSDNVVVDGFFYDRMIEGYSRADHVGKMMTFLTRMSKDGLQPSWKALTAIVEALLRVGDTQRAQEIVADVGERGNRGSGVPDRGHGMQDFWSLVAHEGLGRGSDTGGIEGEVDGQGRRQFVSS
ncbi:hypothetical protein P152DRAFT_474661 [Eremomyces bilateralis CBS 781.70]|uniref:Pentatricopeptide repeat-containing protein n=1 Tax=Eremomyces bilateralis CBS 781.70 TaxID=1392243 RepID=A0A6G1G0P6_9PEZI|nr:uncharacterized protein P152DRAFT_474661 [Eremomyces bilateralis CBS 781.70]KAF1811501.1 hypothetical protein P152DRAFT_474661 [Eremomyces bilateralis CBS 781.70]